MVHLCATWNCGFLASAALMGQAAARLAAAHSSSTLGSPHRFWAAGNAAGHTDIGIRHMVGHRRRLVLRRTQSVELAYWSGLRTHSGYLISHVCTRQTTAQTRCGRQATDTAFRCLAPWQRGALASAAAYRTCPGFARCK